MVHVQKGSLLYVYAKFEADNSIRSKVTKGSQTFEIGSPATATELILEWGRRGEARKAESGGRVSWRGDSQPLPTN